ncbi:hypothetical protein ACFL1E_03440 [Candidatus Omnitrophota bacterium]
MLKKILLFIVTCMFLITIALIIAKDFLLTSAANALLKENFGEDSSVEKIHLSFNGIEVKGVVVAHENFIAQLQSAKVRFGLSATLSPLVAEADISQAYLKTQIQGLASQQDIGLDLNLKHVEDNVYSLTIPSVKMKGKTVKNILAIFEFDKEKIIIREAKSSLLGPLALVQGRIDFHDPNEICVNLVARELSFQNMIDFFDKQEDILFVGPYDGTISFCLQEMVPSKMSGVLSNKKGGVINIKKETSLDFLRKHLDQASYDALIDNFKNYTYNEGEMSVTQYEDIFTIKLNFDSQYLGKRNITINKHSTLGGG